MERTRRVPHWLIGGGIVLVLVAVLVMVWDWNWLRPLVEHEASAELGRPVTLRHFNLRPGRQTTAIAEGITIGDPEGFAAAKNFGTIERLTVTVDVMEYIRHRRLVIPAVVVERPDVEVTETPDGKPNYMFPAQSGSSDTELRQLQITDGRAHVVIPRLKTDFGLTVATTDASPPQVVVDAKGTYAGQPVIGHLVAGSVLTLQDTTQPYPVDLKLAHGPTHVSLVGTVMDPLAFAGARLKLQFAGPDMSLLYPLTGVPIPKTPPFEITGNLDYGQGVVKFHQFAGKVGSSDLEGDLDLDLKPQRPVLSGTLASRLVDLPDLGGFIGSQPGRMSTPNQTAEQKREVAKAEASSQLLPNTPIDLPKLRTEDIHIKYRGAKIAGRDMPFDSIAATLDIEDGRIRLTPVTIGVGQGRIIANMDLTPVKELIHARGDITAQRVDVGRMLQATHMVSGAGLLGGKATIDGTGNSLAAILGNGNGSVQMSLAGGNLSALVVDLAGLQFGKAVLSALGIPERTEISCFITDFALERGVLNTRTMIMDTGEGLVTGTGTIDLRTETLNYLVRTQSKHFTIGSLPAPIGITGKFKDPSIKPDMGALAARGGVVAALAVAFPPAALLPTIQFGIGDDNRCGQLLHGGGAAAK